MRKHRRTACLALVAAAVSIGTVEAGGGKPSFHPAAPPAFHPIRHPAASHRPARPHAFAPAIHDRAHASHKFHKFAFRHRGDLFDLPLIPYGDFGFYSGYYDPSDDADLYPPYPAVYAPASAAADRVGGACRSEEVTVPGSNEPVRVTVTRC
jgi:hypothetical protein